MDSAVSSSEGWFKSSHSSDSQACVEVCFAGDRILMRDSKYQGPPASRPTLSFTNAEWSTFLASL
ncbi:DUF397 domain-containing protein [Nocardia sp. NPDC051321]|uniref:DUF397 domain-containing protein n=1 Tax=Nocardia sp. NPDC051321 TaxID=3364323 RepID=UPI003794EC33